MIQRNHRTAGLRHGGGSGADSIPVWNSSCIRVLFTLEFAEGWKHRFPFQSHTELVAAAKAETQVTFHIMPFCSFQVNSIEGAN
jgi:hypothetical protein